MRDRVDVAVASVEGALDIDGELSRHMAMVHRLGEGTPASRLTLHSGVGGRAVEPGGRGEDDGGPGGPPGGGVHGQGQRLHLPGGQPPSHRLGFRRDQIK